MTSSSPPPPKVVRAAGGGQVVKAAVEAVKAVKAAGSGQGRQSGRKWSKREEQGERREGSRRAGAAAALPAPAASRHEEIVTGESRASHGRVTGESRASHGGLYAGNGAWRPAQTRARVPAAADRARHASRTPAESSLRVCVCARARVRA